MSFDPTDEKNKSILLEIFDRLGGIEATLKNIQRVEEKLEKLEVKLGLVTDRTSKLETFEGRIASYIWLGGAIVSGVLFFLWEGIKYLFPAKDLMNRLFH